MQQGLSVFPTTQWGFVSRTSAMGPRPPSPLVRRQALLSHHAMWPANPERLPADLA